MEAAIGSEEIWNQKQLAKAIGTSVASARVAGQARSLDSIEGSLRIAEGLRAKNLRDGLQAWLQQFHGADFSLETDEQGRTLVSLTDNANTARAGRTLIALRDDVPIDEGSRLGARLDLSSVELVPFLERYELRKLQAKVKKLRKREDVKREDGRLAELEMQMEMDLDDAF